MRYLPLIVLSLFLLTGKTNGETNQPNQVLLNLLLMDRSGTIYNELPDGVITSLDSLFAFAAGTNTHITAAMVQPLADFVSGECRSGKAWKSSGKDIAYGAAIVCVFTNSMQEKLELNYDPVIPDYAMFPCSIRFSETTSDRQQLFDMLIRRPPASNTFIHASLTMKECNTPNPHSGACYSYTNNKTFIRTSLNDRDIMISLTEMQGTSSVSTRGVPVGPEHDFLYYYSNGEGLTIPGFFWVKSRIYYSQSAVVHVSLASNMVACAAFSWLRAGWGGLNVTRTFHIYAVLQTIIDFQQRLMNSPRVSRENIQNIVREVDTMKEDAINREYGRYCTYVEDYYKKGRGSLIALRRPTKLASWYDRNTLSQMPQNFRKALIIQERIRQLLGSPTWSVLPDAPAVESKKKK
jgi:hypothetical protein